MKHDTACVRVKMDAGGIVFYMSYSSARIAHRIFVDFALGF